MKEAAEPKTIVVIDDDQGMRSACQRVLADPGVRVETFGDGAQGLQGIATLKPDLILVDLRMPGMGGMEVISRTREIDPNSVIVVITGYPTIDTAVHAIKAGAYDFLPKPFTPDELQLIVSRGLEHRRLLLDSQKGEIERALLQRRFITFVSHQLQTPLVAVRQYLDVMRHLGDGPPEATQWKEWLDRCLSRCDEMLALIKDWLTLSRVESGALSKERVPVDLKPAILGIVDAYREMAAVGGVSLRADLPESAYPVRGDRTCVAVLLDNLIVNAIRYNKPNGTVTVSAQVAHGEVTIFVADTGIGIPDEAKRVLFQEFFRVRGASSQAPSGTGLGLAICKRIVAEMGGSIDFESEVDVGSTFRVRLPAYGEDGNTGDHDEPRRHEDPSRG